MVDNFKFYCQKILPLVYDDSLSYYETLCKISNKLNEVIEEINTVTVDILEKAKEYTDEAIAENQDFLLRKFDEAVALVDELKRSNALFEQNVNAQINIIRGDFNSYKDVVDSEVIGLKAYTDNAVVANNEYLINKLSEGLNNLLVVNFFTGEHISLQKMFDTLAILHVEDPLTYDLYASKNITYNALASLRISYTDLVLRGKQLIV